MIYFQREIEESCTVISYSDNSTVLFIIGNVLREAEFVSVSRHVLNARLWLLLWDPSRNTDFEEKTCSIAAGLPQDCFL